MTSRDFNFRSGKNMNYKIDEKMKQYFGGRVKQIFLYLTDLCQLRCKQCLYKPNLTFQMARKNIPFDSAMKLLEDFYELGARKVTFMGGEPFLYLDDKENFFKLIDVAKNVGYTYLRADSNGQNDPECYKDKHLTYLNDLSFSIDGYTKEINDPLRGEGSYEKCVEAIKTAVKSGVHVEITSCVHPKLLTIEDGEYGIVKV